MASIYFNPHLPAERGRVILRRYGHRQIYVAAPIRTNTPPTPAMLARRAKFTECCRYAGGVFRHPQRRLAFVDLAKAKGVPLYNAILTEFLKNPVIREVQLGGYHGNVGDPVVVFHRSDLAIVEVRLVVRRSDTGMLVEEGVAALAEDGGWRYVATQAVPAGTALSITLTLTDEDEIQVTRTVPLVVG
jgi:hypothetical protein